VEVQEEAYGLFARLSKSIVPSTPVPLPLSMHSVHPVAVRGSARPVVVSSAGLVAARRNLALYKENGSGGGGGSDVSGAGVDSSVDGSSSLFYDPFAAKRQKQHTLAQKNTLLYSVHLPVTLLVTLANPLCIPLLLNAVFPVLTGVLHTVYPISIQIPPYTEHYTVELVFVPSSVGSVTIHGVQVVMNNATYVLRVDKDGYCCDPHRYDSQLEHLICFVCHITLCSLALYVFC